MSDDDSPRRDRSPMRDDENDDHDRRGSRNNAKGRDSRSGGGGGGGRRATVERRIYISNIPYETRWQDVKDLFVKEVGEVTYVNLFKDERGKARGCGIIEFSTEDAARDAVDKMHRYKLNGREIVVKEDTDRERDRYGYIVKDGSGVGRIGGGAGGVGGGNIGGGMIHNRIRSEAMDDPSSKFGNTYGLNVQFLRSLGIDGPLVSRVFVANLDYKVDERKLESVFKLAGKVCNAEIHRDKEGNSRGYGTVEFEHPVEAVQAISMFRDQILFERKMSVRMDSTAMREEAEGIPNKLPVGLKGIGMGLGSGGAPLKNIQRECSNSSSNNNVAANALSGLIGGGLGGGGLGNLGGLGGGLGLGGINAAALSGSGVGLGGGLGSGGGLGGLQPWK